MLILLSITLLLSIKTTLAQFIKDNSITDFYLQDQLRIQIESYFPHNNLSVFEVASTCASATILSFASEFKTTALGFTTCTKPIKKQEKAFFIFCTDGVKSSILWFLFSPQLESPNYSVVSEIELEDNLGLTDYDYDPSTNELFVLGTLNEVLYLYSYYAFNPIGPSAKLKLDFLLLSKDLRLTKSRNSTYQTVAIYESGSKSSLEFHLLNYSGSAFSDAGFWSSSSNITGLGEGTVHRYIFNDISGYAVITDSQSNLLLQSCPVHFGSPTLVACKPTKHKLMVSLDDSFIIHMDSFDISTQTLSVLAANRGTLVFGTFTQTGVYTNQKQITVDLGPSDPTRRFLALAKTSRGDFYSSYTMFGQLFALQYLALQNTFTVWQIEGIDHSLAAPYFQSNPLAWAQDEFLFVGDSGIFASPVRPGALLLVDFISKEPLPSKGKLDQSYCSVSVIETTWETSAKFDFRVWEDLGIIQAASPPFVSEYDYFSLLNQNTSLHFFKPNLLGNALSFSLDSEEASLNSRIIYANDSQVKFNIGVPIEDVIELITLNFGFLVVKYRNATVSIFRCAQTQNGELSCLFQINTGSLVCSNIIDSIAVPQTTGFSIYLLTSLSTGAMLLEFPPSSPLLKYTFPVKLQIGKFFLDSASGRLVFLSVGQFVSSPSFKCFILEMNLTDSNPAQVPNQVNILDSVDLQNVLRVESVIWVDVLSFQLLFSLSNPQSEQPSLTVVRYLLTGTTSQDRNAVLAASSHIPPTLLDPTARYCLIGQSFWIVSGLKNHLLSFDLDPNESTASRYFLMKDVMMDFGEIELLECNTDTQTLAVKSATGALFVFDARGQGSPINRLLSASQCVDEGVYSIASLSFYSSQGNVLFNLMLGSKLATAKVILMGGPFISTSILSTSVVEASAVVKVKNNRGSVSQNLTMVKVPYSNKADWIINRNVDIDTVSTGYTFSIKNLITIDAPIGNYSVNGDNSGGKIATVTQNFVRDVPLWDIEESVLLGNQVDSKTCGDILFVYTGNFITGIRRNTQQASAVVMKFEVKLDKFELFNTSIGPGVVYMRKETNGSVSLGVFFGYSPNNWLQSEISIINSDPSLNTKSLFVLNENTTCSQSRPLRILAGFVNASYSGETAWMGYFEFSSIGKLSLLDSLEIYDPVLLISNAAITFLPNNQAGLFILYSNSMTQSLFTFSIFGNSIKVQSQSSLSTIANDYEIPPTNSTCISPQPFILHCAYQKSRTRIIAMVWNFSLLQPAATPLFSLTLVPYSNIGPIFFNENTAAVFLQIGLVPTILFYRHSESCQATFSIVDPAFKPNQFYSSSVVGYGGGNCLLLLVGNVYPNGNYLCAQDALLQTGSLFKTADFTGHSMNLTIVSVDGGTQTDIDFSLIFFRGEKRRSQMVWIVVLVILCLLGIAIIGYFLRLRLSKNGSKRESIKKLEEEGNYYNFEEEGIVQIQGTLPLSRSSNGTQKKGISRSFENGLKP